MDSGVSLQKCLGYNLLVGVGNLLGCFLFESLAFYV